MVQLDMNREPEDLTMNQHTLADVSLRNPVFAVMLAVGMLVFGLLGYRELGISQFPETEFPVVSINTSWEDAAPEIVDSEVTDVIEDAISQVEGIDNITSQSMYGQSSVTVTFRLGRNVDAAQQDVQNAIASVYHRLPADIIPPHIRRSDPNRHPAIWLCFHGTAPRAKLNAFVEDFVKPRLESAPGAGRVFISGNRLPSLRIWVDPLKLHAYNLEIADVLDAITREHVETPSGILTSKALEFNVQVAGTARDVQDFANLIVAEREGRLVRLGEVAIIEDGIEDRRTFARFNRHPTVGTGVIRSEGSNLVALCDEVYRRLENEIEPALPKGVEYAVAVDYSRFVREDIREVEQTLLGGIVLTAIVTLLFLRSPAITLNVCLSIPCSLIGAFFAMELLGFTINLMTLLALSLSVGVVVDDAILVVESIQRRREQGQRPRQAALEGTRAVTFAATAATLVIVAIFLPVAFLEGTIGRYFYEFGVTVSVAVLLSLVTALTITPVLAAWQPFGERPLHHAIGSNSTRARARWSLENFYRHTLVVVLRYQILVALLAIILFAFSYALWFGVEIPLGNGHTFTIKPVGREIIPSQDQSRFLVNVRCPVGVSVGYIEEILTRCEEIAFDTPEVVRVFSQTRDASGGSMFLGIVPPHERTRSQEEIAADVRGKLSKVLDAKISVVDLSMQGFSANKMGYPVYVAIVGPEWSKVVDYSREIMKKMETSGKLIDVGSDYRPAGVEARIVPDRQKSAELGVSIAKIARTINALVGGSRIANYQAGDQHRRDVRVRLLANERDSPNDLARHFVRNRAGKLIPLSDLTKIEYHPSQPIIDRYNHQRYFPLRANASPEVSQGEAVDVCLTIVDEVLPRGYRAIRLGNSQALDDTFRSLVFALWLAVIMSYMVLGVQFNSFLHPVVVFLALPFALTGALATLWFFQDTLNLLSMIGLILLLGLVMKNSIVLVDHINQLRDEGKPVRAAVLDGCPDRLRAILMTTLATVASALPLALGIGAGAETRAPMARAIIGGIMLSTLVTLIVVPVFYLMLERLAPRTLVYPEVLPTKEANVKKPAL